VFFFEKRTKKRLDFGLSDPANVHANEQKSFASFLQKRNPFLLCQGNAPGRRLVTGETGFANPAG
jgi:hypothetical protein